MYLSGLGCSAVTIPCGISNEISGSMEGENFLNLLSDS